MGRIELGKEGEDEAVKFLKVNGYKIHERNWKRTYGELDIVAFAPDKTLVFVEVKTLNFIGGGLKPEDQMTRDKMTKFKRVSEVYANEHQNLINEREGWRCDVLTLTKIEKDFLIKHYENV